MSSVIQSSDKSKPGPKKKSPYIIPKSIKMREGMKELLSDLTEHLGTESEQRTIELALLALIEKKGNKELKSRYTNITKTHDTTPQ